MIVCIAYIMTPEAAIDLLKGCFSFGYVPPGAAVLTASVIAYGYGGGDPVGYTLYLREKGYGMAQYLPGHIKGLAAKGEPYIGKGWYPSTKPEDIKNFKRWYRLMTYDNAIVCTGLSLWGALMYLIAAALILHPRGIVPSGLKVASEQARFFSIYMGKWGEILFLFLVPITMLDTTMTNLDLGSRPIADYLYTYVFKRKKGSVKAFYWAFLLVGVVVSIPLFYYKLPLFFLYTITFGVLLITVLTTSTIIYVNSKYLPKEYKPHPIFLFLCGCCVAFMAYTLVYWTGGRLGLW